MSFLFPAFLLGALAVAIPIALHLLRRDVAPDVPFSAVRLLRTSPIERTRRRRLRDLLLLAARVTALALLAFAFARPYLTSAAGPGAPLRIVAVDRSYSLSAPGRLERVVEMAREAIDEVSRSDRVALVAFDDRPHDLAPPGSVSDARAALAGLRAGAGGTRYAPMIARAAEMAGGTPGRLIIITDLQRAGWDDGRLARVPSSLAVEVRDAGPPGPNLAVTAAVVRGDRMVATVRNDGPARRSTVRLTRANGSAEVASAAFAVGAGESADVPIALRAPTSGPLAVTVEDPDGHSADNTLYLLNDSQAAAPVLIVTAPGAQQAGFYVSRALAVAAGDDETGGDAMRARVLAASELAGPAAPALESHSATVLLATRGLERRTRDSLAAAVRAGAGLLVAAAPEVEPDVLSAMFGWAPAVTGVEQAHAGVALGVTDLRHPIFRPFGPLMANLGHVTFTRTWRVSSDGWTVAARFTDGTAALLERAEGKGRVVLFASDLDRRWNDFPLHAAFVPFVIEAVRYLASDARPGGEYTVATVPAGVPAEPGIHVSPGSGRPVAVNVDPAEGDPSTMTAEEFDGMLDRVSQEPGQAVDVEARDAEASQGLWQYGLLVMLAALVAESVVGRARG